MKREVRIRFFEILLFILLIPLSVLGCKNIKSEEILKVTKWDNIYEGKNIHFYYEDFNNSNIKELNNLYKLNEVVKGTDDEFEKAKKLNEWVKEKIEFNYGSDSIKDDAINILKEVESLKKASDKDMTIVFNQSATSVGLYNRRGELRSKSNNSKVKIQKLNISEIWSDKYNKWIMLDVANSCYMEYGGVPLSAVEIVSKGLENINIIGVKNGKKYIKDFKGVFYSYSVQIDNNIYGVKKSNSYVTYINEGNLPQINNKGEFVSPAIFINKPDLLGLSPKVKYIDDKSDKIPTIILMKKNADENKENSYAFSLGVSKNSVMINSFYISINGSTWTKINKYIDITLLEGVNNIKISEDGNTVVREVVIEFIKKK